MIHRFKTDGMNIVVDVYSGSIHVTDDTAYDFIGVWDEKGRDAAIEAYSDLPDIDELTSDIDELVSAGRLFAEDIFGDNAFDLKNRNEDIKALCLHVSHACDLACEYCFAKQGSFCGPEALMSADTAKRAIDFLIEHSGGRHNLEVDFFGGEPLLNMDVVKETVAYARSVEKEHNKNFRFTLTTNGMKLDDDIIDFCNREMDNVVLSLDGRKEVHDRFRITPGGEGSYDTVVPKFRDFVNKRGGRSYYIRGTFTHFNTDFFNDIAHMLDLGFKELSMEPVVTGPDSPSALTEEDLPGIYEQYERLAEEMIKRDKEGDPFTFYHYMIDLMEGPCIYKRISGCGSGTEYFAVTPWGDLYPCHQFVNDPEMKMGNIYDGITENALSQMFRGSNSYTKPECAECWARLYCSGGCAANAYHQTGSVNGVYEYGCRLFKKRIECAIMVKLALMDE